MQHGHRGTEDIRARRVEHVDRDAVGGNVLGLGQRRDPAGLSLEHAPMVGSRHAGIRVEGLVVDQRRSVGGREVPVDRAIDPDVS